MPHRHPHSRLTTQGIRGQPPPNQATYYTERNYSVLFNKIIYFTIQKKNFMRRAEPGTPDKFVFLIIKFFILNFLPNVLLALPLLYKLFFFN